jgi:hypothetical protein
MSDQAKLLGLTLHAWGTLLFLMCAAAIYVRYAAAPSARALFEAATLVLLALFVLMTEMHERYLYYGLFFAVALVSRKAWRDAVLLLSATFVLNLEYALTYMYLNDAGATMVDRGDFAPWLVHLCAGANVAVFVTVLYRFLQSKPGSAREPAAVGA